MRRLLLAAIIAALTAAAPAQATTPFTIGSGVDPDVIVDQFGAGHFAWVDGQTIRYCRVPRGASACAVTHSLALPAPPASGPAANQGPARILISSTNTVRIVFYVAGGADPPSAYTYTSVNNGSSFPTLNKAGSLQPVSGQFGGRLTFSSPAAGYVTGGISGSDPAVQTSPFTVATTSKAVFNEPFVAEQDVAASLDSANRPVAAYSDGSSVFWRRSAAGDANTLANWGARQTAASGHLARLSSSALGLFLGYAQGNHFFVSKWNGASFPAGVETTDPAKATIFEPALYAQRDGGNVFASWRDQGYGVEELRVAASANGTAFNPSFPIARDGTMSKHKIATGLDNQGFATWESSAGTVRVVPLDPIAEQTTGGGTNPPTSNPPTSNPPTTNPPTTNPGTGTAPSNPLPGGQLTVGNEVLQLFGPTACVVPGQKIKLRVTSKRKKKLAGNKGRSKITQATFYVDTTKKKDKKKAFQQSFPTTGFAAGSKHKLGAKLKLKQLSGKKKAYGKTLKGSFTMCV